MEKELYEIVGRLYTRGVGLEQHIGNLYTTIKSLQAENLRLSAAVKEQPKKKK